MLTFEEVMEISQHIDTEKNAGLYELAKIAMERAALAERERCAQVCEGYANRHAKDDDYTKAQAWMMLQCAAAIRKG